MGPLVPDIVGNELNLVVALLLGIGFGFVLEQAGFSSCRRLAGLFYGQDFVVLRVFFVAAITAMVGVIILTWLGLLDLSLIYINPTYLRSAIIGGLIMGGGFILGGYCPGTSVCAAAIGKIDAMVFILGIFLGVFGFSEGYPLIQGLYTADFMGSPLVNESLGLSRGLFGFLLIFAALAAFAVTGMVEQRVNKRVITPPWRNNRHTALTALALLAGLLIIFMPDHRLRALELAGSENWEEQRSTVETIAPDDLAFRLVERDTDLRLIDVRPTDEWKLDHIPTAVSIPFDSLANPEWRPMLTESDRTHVFYANDDELAGRACVLVRALGNKEDIYRLDGGLPVFNRDILAAKKPFSSANSELYDATRFYDRIPIEIEKLRAEEKPRVITPPKRRKAKGGC